MFITTEFGPSEATTPTSVWWANRWHKSCSWCRSMGTPCDGGPCNRPPCRCAVSIRQLLLSLVLLVRRRKKHRLLPCMRASDGSESSLCNYMFIDQSSFNGSRHSILSLLLFLILSLNLTSKSYFSTFSSWVIPYFQNLSCKSIQHIYIYKLKKLGDI